MLIKLTETKRTGELSSAIINTDDICKITSVRGDTVITMRSDSWGLWVAESVEEIWAMIPEEED